MNSFYITTPIYYVNAMPHVGHAYTTIAADTMARFKHMCGFNTYFLTGSDEHGQKIEQVAFKQGKTPMQLADSVVDRYHLLWKRLNISNNDFIRTTEERHIKTVQYVFEKLLSSGDIYEGEYEGWYCTPCESFLMEGQLLDGNLCPYCSRPTARMKEPTYFFRMSKYQNKLLKHIEDNPTFIRPESRRNEVVSFIKEGLRDLSVSRLTSSWGVPVPTDKNHVVYVWVDALVNYISALGYSQENDKLYHQYWQSAHHLVGKDIIRFHAVYWSALLMALGLPLFKSVYAHGWWTVEGHKMSKSLGNVVDPMFLADTFGVDPVRYFLMREVTFGLDGDFSYKALIRRVNTDLSNGLGNLITRTLGMVERYFESTIPSPEELDRLDIELHRLIKSTATIYVGHMNDMSFNKALLSVWDLVGGLNKYIDDTQPWLLAKSSEFRGRLGTILYNVCDGLRLLSNFINPFMPSSSTILREQLGLSAEVCFDSEYQLGDVGLLPHGTKLGIVTPLFPRLDEKELMDTLLGATPKRGEEAGKISFADFEKVSILVALVEHAEHIPKSDKLLKLIVNDGATVRTIVSNTAESFSPEYIVGKKVAIVANLKPVKLMGIESNGMLLTSYSDGKDHLLIMPTDVPLGSSIA